jgi:hypothetical protein
MVRVARFAIAEQARTGSAAGQQRESRRLAEIDAAPRHVERPAWLGRDQLECIETEQHAPAQSVDAANHRRVRQSAADQPFGLREYLGAGRTGGGHGDADAGQSERLLHESPGRMRRVRVRAAHRFRETALLVELPVGVFGLADARRRGAEHHRHPRGAEALCCSGDRIDKAILVQTQPRQPVVAALPPGQPGRQGGLLQPVYPADPGRDRRLAEIVGSQPARTRTERGERCAAADAGCRTGGIRGDLQRHDRRRGAGAGWVIGHRLQSPLPASTQIVGTQSRTSGSTSGNQSRATAPAAAGCPRPGEKTASREHLPEC